MNNTSSILVIFGFILFIAIALVFALRRRRAKIGTEDPYTEALKLLVENDVEGAFKKLQLVIKKRGAPLDAYMKLGELLRERGEHTKALQIHQSLTVKTRMSKKEQIELAVNLARDYEELGKIDRAIKILESITKKLEVRDTGFYLLMSKYYNRLGRYDQAYDNLKVLRKLAAVEDKHVALFLCSSAEREIHRHNQREAKKFLQKAIKHDPNCAFAYFLLGEIESEDGHIDEAIERWKEAALLEEELAGRAVGKLERILFERGKFGEIERIYKQILNKRTGDENITIALANFYKKQGKIEEAAEVLNDFLAWNHNSVGATLSLISNYSRQKDLESVENLVDDSIKRFSRKNTFKCFSCGFRSDFMRWHCPACNDFDSFSLSHES